MSGATEGLARTSLVATIGVRVRNGTQLTAVQRKTQGERPSQDHKHVLENDLEVGVLGFEPTQAPPMRR